MKLEEKFQYLRILDTLTDAFGDNEGQTNDEIRENLRQEGFNIETIEGDLMELQNDVAMAAKRQVLDEARLKQEKNQSMNQAVLEKIKRLSYQQVLERIKKLTSIYPDLAISYRQIEEKKSEDLRTLLEDLERALLISEGDD